MWERFFRYHGVVEDDKVYAASINLEGMALDWIQSYEISNAQVAWEIFSKNVI